MIRISRGIGLIVTAGLWWGGVGATADDVRLCRKAVVIGPDVTLGEVAELQGEEAEALKELVVGRIDEAEHMSQITMASLRAALQEQDVNWARLSLRGFATCSIQRGEEAAGKTTAGPADSLAAVPTGEVASSFPTGAEANAGPTIDLLGPTTLRDRVLTWIEQQTGTGRAGLRITWTPRDEGVLATRAVTDRYEFVPRGHGRIGRLSLRINRYRGIRLVDQYLVTPVVEKRVIAVISTATIGRGESIDPDQIELREVYLDRDDQEVVIDPSLLAGRVAATVLRPGTLIEERHMRVPLAARRGELISVRVFVQDLVVAMTARAMKDGAVGDIVEMKNEHRNSRETFMARLVGPQQAVLIDAAIPDKLAQRSRGLSRTLGGGTP